MSCVTLINLASIHSIGLCWNCKFFTLLLKQAHWTERVWNSVLSHFSIWHSTFPPFLCALMFSFLPSLGFSWYPRPGMERSLALFEHPSALRKVASFVCKLFFTTLRTWFNITMQEKGKFLFQTTVTSVRLKSLPMSTRKRERTRGSF